MERAREAASGSGGLRIVLAFDASPTSDAAAALIAGAQWPDGSVVRIVSSPVGIDSGISSFANAREARAHTRRLTASIESAQAEVAGKIARPGLGVETAIVGGPPARAVLNQAKRLPADLVVAGARNQGRITAALLGSVSGELVEGARCSVLVARGATVRRVLLAADGSPPSRVAARIVGSWPLFRDAELRVLGVVPPRPRYAGLVLSPVEVDEAYAETTWSETTTAAGVVAATVEQLRGEGRLVDAEIRTGDPGAEIVNAASEWSPDLTVFGSNAEPLLRRLLLGTVARTVLHGIRSSALVVRADRPRNR
jgi:nucleotide-binding universal stress UspA family protein